MDEEAQNRAAGILAKFVQQKQLSIRRQAHIVFTPLKCQSEAQQAQLFEKTIMAYKRDNVGIPKVEMVVDNGIATFRVAVEDMDMQALAKKVKFPGVDEIVGYLEEYLSKSRKKGNKGPGANWNL